MLDDVELLKRVYDLFNSRDIESVLLAVQWRLRADHRRNQASFMENLAKAYE
jgi:hypothetical protein